MSAEAHTIRRKGLMLALSSPSGTGKTAISRELLRREEALSLSISATTRAPRPGEIEGEDYFFLTPSAFEKKIEAGDFLEHARVFDRLYGTPAAPVTEALDAGRDVLFDIDWQGARQIAEKMPHDLIRIFILPPSLKELEIRLRRRGQDSEEVIRKRLDTAVSEIRHFEDYDYVLVNREITQSVNRVQSILTAERLKRDRQIGLKPFVNALCDGKE